MTLRELFLKNKENTNEILVVIIDDISRKNDGYFHKTSKYPLDFMIKHRFGKCVIVSMSKEKEVLQPHIVFDGIFPKEKYNKIALEELF